MKEFNKVVIVYPIDQTIGFLEPIRKTLMEIFPNACCLRPKPGDSGQDIDKEVDLFIFLGHGAPNKLLGGIDEKGEKSLFLDIDKGSLLFNEASAIIFACNSSDYLDRVRANAKIVSYLTFGDMPTDWEHINKNRNLDPNYLYDFQEEHLIYYKEAIVESMVEGLRNGFESNSILGVAKRISLIVNKKINEVLLSKSWKVSQKLQMIELLVDYKNDLMYAQPLC